MTGCFIFIMLFLAKSGLGEEMEATSVESTTFPDSSTSEIWSTSKFTSPTFTSDFITTPASTAPSTGETEVTTSTPTISAVTTIFQSSITSTSKSTSQIGTSMSPRIETTAITTTVDSDTPTSIITSTFFSTTSNPSCGAPRIQTGTADTSQVQVKLTWAVNGCDFAVARSRIQIAKSDQRLSDESDCDEITWDQPCSCSVIEASLDVDYDSAANNCSKLNPFQIYKASVAQFCTEADCGCVVQEETGVTFRTPPQALSKGGDEDLTSPESSPYCPQTLADGQLLLRLNASYFNNAGAPPIIGYHIVIGSGEKFDSSWFETAVSYSEAARDSFKKPFYATHVDNPLNPFSAGSEATGCCSVVKDDQSTCANDLRYSASADILVGDTKCDSKVDANCIGLMPKGESFWVGLMAVPDTSFCDDSVYCDELKKKVYVSSSITVLGTQDTQASGPNVGAIVGGVIGASVLLGVVIIGTLLYFRSRNRPIRQILPMLQTPGRSRPIDLFRYQEILPDLLRDSAFALLREFSSLCDQSPSIRGQKYVTGLREDNMPKNRYADILPFDDSRVTLEGERYINASFIRGFRRQKEYIAAQGPMGECDRRTRGKHSTIDDFFEMIWQQNIYCIVMLTQLLEAGRPKCARYWPPEVGIAEQHGIFTVYLHSETDCDTFMMRDLELQRSGQSRFVLQYHYKRWPDMTATDETELLAFARLVRSHVHTSGVMHPLLVHCSAGVGRTGVFIALDILLQHIRQRSYVDIASCVFALRQQRVRMEQYVMLYSAMGIAIQQRLATRHSRMSNDGDGVDHTLSLV